MQIKRIGHSTSKKARGFLRLALLLIAFSASILVTSCNLESFFSSEESNQDQLMVYTSIPLAQAEHYLTVFNAEYPNIEVKLSRDSAGAIMQRFFDEAENPQADVIWGVGASGLLIAEWRDMLKAYAPKGLERVAPLFRDTAAPPHWVGMDALMAAFCVNTEMIEQLDLPMPDSWDDLVKPIYSGQIVMANAKSSGVGFFIVSGVLQTKGAQEGWTYLDELHDNIALYPRTAIRACNLAATGEYAIGLSSAFRGTVERKEGYPIKIVFPTEKSNWDIRANALVKKKKIKTEARTFLDWAISDSAMNEYAQKRPLPSVQTDHPVPEGFPDDPTTQLIDNDLPWSSANRANILNEWFTRYGDKIEVED